MAGPSAPHQAPGARRRKPVVPIVFTVLYLVAAVGTFVAVVLIADSVDDDLPELPSAIEEEPAGSGSSGGGGAGEEQPDPREPEPSSPPPSETPDDGAPPAGSGPEAFEPLVERVRQCFEARGLSSSPPRGDPTGGITGALDDPRGQSVTFIWDAVGKGLDTIEQEFAAGGQETYVNDGTVLVMFTASPTASDRALADECIAALA